MSGGFYTGLVIGFALPVLTLVILLLTIWGKGSAESRQNNAETLRLMIERNALDARKVAALELLVAAADAPADVVITATAPTKGKSAMKHTFPEVFIGPDCPCDDTMLLMASFFTYTPVAGLMIDAANGDMEAAKALAVRLIGYLHFTPAFEAVLLERAKQIRKGYGAKNDDTWTLGQLITGARCYIETALIQTNTTQPLPGCFKHKEWPWAPSTFHAEQDRKANLIKAIAMLIAEVERIEREEGAKKV